MNMNVRLAWVGLSDLLILSLNKILHSFVTYEYDFSGL